MDLRVRYAKQLPKKLMNDEKFQAELMEILDNEEDE
jgi:hypothetical protein